MALYCNLSCLIVTVGLNAATTVRVDTYARTLDDLDDNEVILIGDEVEGYQEFSGVALKQEFEQTQSKLDRLRGCVVR